MGQKDEEFQCKWCPKKYKFKSFMIRHQNVCKGPKPEEYKCQWCPKKYKFKSDMIRHQNACKCQK
jgi:redox-regulated HSP33 family molecular chaperone